MDAPLIELRGITKAFPGVVALDAVDLTLRSAEVHALTGAPEGQVDGVKRDDPGAAGDPAQLDQWRVRGARRYSQRITLMQWGLSLLVPDRVRSSGRADLAPPQSEGQGAGP